MSGNERRPLFGGAVNVDRQGLAMPVQLLRRVGFVVDVDNNLPALPEAQKRPGKLAVIKPGGYDVVGRKLDQTVSDADGMIGAALRTGNDRPGRVGRGRHLGLRQPRNGSGENGSGSQFQKRASIDRHAHFSKDKSEPMSRQASGRKDTHMGAGVSFTAPDRPRLRTPA